MLEMRSQMFRFFPILTLLFVVVTVPRSWSVELFKDRNYGGDNVTVPGPGCQKVPDNLKNKASSVKVHAQDTVGRCVTLYNDGDCNEALITFKDDVIDALSQQHQQKIDFKFQLFQDAVASVRGCGEE